RGAPSTRTGDRRYTVPPPASTNWVQRTASSAGPVGACRPSASIRGARRWSCRVVPYRPGWPVGSPCERCAWVHDWCAVRGRARLRRRRGNRMAQVWEQAKDELLRGPLDRARSRGIQQRRDPRRHRGDAKGGANLSAKGGAKETRKGRKGGAQVSAFAAYPL